MKAQSGKTGKAGTAKKPAVTARKVGAKKIASMTKKGRIDLPKRGR